MWLIFLICRITYTCKIPKSWFNNQYLKQYNRQRKKQWGLNWMENFKIESTYVKLCYEFRTFIRLMKAAFYRQDYQKFLMCPLIKRLGWVLSTRLSQTFEGLRESEKLGREFEKLGQVFVLQYAPCCPNHPR